MDLLRDRVEEAGVEVRYETGALLPSLGADHRAHIALYAGFTLGGLRTTVDAQVQRPDGSVIPGLYAAGACASNIAQDGKGYGSGTQLGEGSFFGRRADQHAAQLPPTASCASA
jgi:predicted oxidoreductase